MRKSSTSTTTVRTTQAKKTEKRKTTPLTRRKTKYQFLQLKRIKNPSTLPGISLPTPSQLPRSMPAATPLEDHSIEFRLAVPKGEGYIRNPVDYMDTTGYEALLQNLAETDSGGWRGAPPASKASVEALETTEIKSELEALACAVCKDIVGVREMVKKLPCGHGYHGDCIIPWLGSRNSCPVYRYELPTDDAEYEEERKKRAAAAVAAAAAAALSSSSGGIGGISGDYEILFF
ncbi:E3 ubiquitin-protein ligase CIP8-like [Coffea eugenioides]|uniref:E3 ubiquitin-protein ligase CIP8-like n=1 Tax=Coffea eugenioides TaxID=49369 RepID=UPI000F607981|nr:E3 ubiquitin-protein ligase CIP8-like [Coffea eugenioides]